MGSSIGGMFSNESLYGRIMTRCGIIIGANLMFILFSLPIITIGPSFAALYHVMLKVLRGNTELNPFKEFWKGFKSNFRQAFVYFIGISFLAIIGILDVRFCRSQGGSWQMFTWVIYVIGLTILIITAYFFPVLAAFADTIPHLIRNAVFFAVKNPVRMIVLLILDVVPMYVTYLDVQRQPRYVFVWAVCGFALTGMIGAKMLIRDFAQYLPPVEDPNAEYTEMRSLSSRQTLKEMKRLDA